MDTDIRLAVTRNLRELFKNESSLQSSASIGPIYELLMKNPSAFDPRVFLPPIMGTVMYGNVPDDDVGRIVDCIERGVKEVVGTLIVEFDSVGKVPLVKCVSLDEMAERYRQKGIRSMGKNILIATAAALPRSSTAPSRGRWRRPKLPDRWIRSTPPALGRRASWPATS